MTLIKKLIQVPEAVHNGDLVLKLIEGVPYEDPQAAVYRDRDDFGMARPVGELVADESVPLLPVLRYKLSGLAKRL